MKKKIKQYGNSKVIVFTKEECELYQLEVGDVLEIDMQKNAYCGQKNDCFRSSHNVSCA